MSQNTTDVASVENTSTNSTVSDVETPVSVAPEQPVVETQSIPAPAPVAQPQVKEESKIQPVDLQSKMANEIAALKAELQKSNIKSALAERRLVPMDADLVSGMIMDRIGTGLSPDQACASLYQSHPYLFKNSTSAKVSEVDKAEEAKMQKDLNDRFVSSVTSRLRRDVVEL